MITNRFAEELDDYKDGRRAAFDAEYGYCKTSSGNLKPGGMSRRSKSSEISGDALANRVSFYMDDVVFSSNDDFRDMQTSNSSRHHFSVRKNVPDVARISTRSFRNGERSTKKVSRHSSDVSHMRKPSKLQRKRSYNRRHPVARHESLELKNHLHKCYNIPQYQRSVSVKSYKRQDSVPLRYPEKSTSTLKLPYKELPPKERRRRAVVLMVFVTFLFLVVCSVLAVVVTLTHSSFHNSPSIMDNDNVFLNRSQQVASVRKENEQHQSYLNPPIYNGLPNSTTTSTTPPTPPST